jgi:hypothetical protein
VLRLHALIERAGACCPSISHDLAAAALEAHDIEIEMAKSHHMLSIGGCVMIVICEFLIGRTIHGDHLCS